MYFLLNLVGLIVIMAVVFLCSPQKKKIKWRPIITLIVLELLITWFMLGTKVGSYHR